MTRPARTVREVLVAARWILENVGWTKGVYARNSRGQSTLAQDAGAQCFCGMGATYAVLKQNMDLGIQARALLGDMVAFNDAPSTTLPMVLARFDEAIARAK